MVGDESWTRAPGNQSWNRALGNQSRHRAPLRKLSHVRLPLTSMLAAIIASGRAHQGPTDYPIVS